MINPLEVIRYSLYSGYLRIYNILPRKVQFFLIESGTIEYLTTTTMLVILLAISLIVYGFSYFIFSSLGNNQIFSKSIFEKFQLIWWFLLSPYIFKNLILSEIKDKKSEFIFLKNKYPRMHRILLLVFWLSLLPTCWYSFLYGVIPSILRQ